ncbi:nucleotidyltransferase domain-containing protein [Larkinella terrae]|uniref:Nucleotidyltransferase domain-containing protein n=1 Tax=Larkinella terrae TaxID=2025311 RepID=A0A7K0EN37_9BACT|nr:nucleotidyltransferase domain-containing protein [Larkinella terrae]MRS63215.1 nucleotidyltransferase domain-containing protein [Larkinella terrae]
MDQTSIQPLLTSFKKEAQRLYQDRLAALYLFGSYARGDAGDYSDVDILVVLNDEMISPFQELETMGDFTFELELTHEKPIQIVPTTKKQFNKLSSPLYHNVKREGLAL